MSRPVQLPRDPASSSRVSSKENRALEFFYHKTAPQLSGFFGQSFWNGSVLYFSLTEAAIRQSIIALSTLHETVTSVDSLTLPSTKDRLLFSLQSYNRAIQLLLKKAHDSSSIPVVILASIVLTCVECLRGNATAAVIHITCGTRMLRTWREKFGEPRISWGLCHKTFESSFIEKELAPILSSLSISTAEFSPSCPEVYLNPVDPSGCLTLGNEFRSLGEARAGLIDVITAAMKIIRCVDQARVGGGPSHHSPIEVYRLKATLHHWKANFDDLVRRRAPSWDEQERGAANFVRITWHSTNVGLSVSLAANEMEWDAYKSDFEEIIQLVESLMSNSEQFPDEASKTFSFEIGLISPFHAVAWKCRWPHLRRKGLALLLKTPRRECLFDAELYYAIFSRIMAIEEAHLRLPLGNVPEEQTLPPEHLRVHHFHTEAILEAGETLYSVTFLTKPKWPSHEWHYWTEYLDLGASSSCKRVPTSPLLEANGLAKSGTSGLPVVNLFRTMAIEPYLSMAGASETSPKVTMPLE